MPEGVSILQREVCQKHKGFFKKFLLVGLDIKPLPRALCQENSVCSCISGDVK